jgi:hypothetical protein
MLRAESGLARGAEAARCDKGELRPDCLTAVKIIYLLLDTINNFKYIKYNIRQQLILLHVFNSTP